MSVGDFLERRELMDEPQKVVDFHTGMTYSFHCCDSAGKPTLLLGIQSLLLIPAGT